MRGRLIVHGSWIKIIITFAFLLIPVILYSLVKDKLHGYLQDIHLYTRFLAKHSYIRDTRNIKSLSTYAVCKSQLSKPLTCDNLTQGRIYISNTHNLVTWSVFVSDNWGNTLSPYWQARGAAFLLGNSFTCNEWHTHSWIGKLPISVAPLPSDSCIKTYPELFRRMCDDAGPDCNMVYAHKCVGAWNYIRDQIQQNTRSAMERWAGVNNKTIPVFNISEMVVFDRCSPDTILDHNEHGPLAHSVFQYIPKAVTTLYQVYAKARTTSLCDSIRQSQIAHLKRIRPDVTIIPSPDNLWEDFSKLVYAPYVLVISAGSSFALWSTLANVGQVWMPPLYGGMTPDVGSNFHWINTPVLYPEVGRKFNLTNSTKITDVNRIVEWLRNR